LLDLPQINAPWAFTTVWSFVKPLLDEVTVSKIQILGGDYLKTIEKQIPIQNIPKFLGGKCTCPEGCTLSNAGPWNDKDLVEKVKSKNRQAQQEGSAQANGAAQPVPVSQPAPTTTTPTTQPPSAPAPVPVAVPVPAPAPISQQATHAEAAPAPPKPTAAPVIIHEDQMTTVVSRVDA